MTLSFGKSSPKDMLIKAHRDLARLEAAEVAQETEGVSDALFDFAVAITSVKDWLKNHPSSAFSAAAVEQYSAASAALSSFQDIANTGKHCLITRYVPKTNDVLTSAPSSGLAFINEAGSTRNSSSWRLKIIRRDGSRHRAVDLGRAAVEEWEAFIRQHTTV
jgi:hypothetical protein